MSGRGRSTSARFRGRRPAAADSPIAVDVVVERELLAGLDVPLGKDTHAYPLADGPFRDVAVGIATVVRKAADAALLRGIDELQRRQRG